ncbi:MAG: sensor histidine kinase, partial [Ferruginibacter sp.]
AQDRSKTFPRLAPGRYTFRVRSALSNNFDGASEAAYTFTIDKPFWKKWWFILLTIGAISGLLYWYVHKREQDLRKVERLQQEKIQFQFQVLRNQVNPHFLFNSFNTLISTIEENPTVAVDYVEHLSDFFRNIVNYRDKDVITLNEELELLQTYYYLQQKRFGNNLQLNINLTDTEKRAIKIPPLTLQLLMENAVKHNAVSRDTPLLVKVYSDDQYIVIENNINVRTSKQVGAGMGLQNIISRYNLLCNGKVAIKHTEQYFSVSLPAIKNIS